MSRYDEVIFFPPSNLPAQSSRCAACPSRPHAAWTQRPCSAPRRYTALRIMGAKAEKETKKPKEDKVRAQLSPLTAHHSPPTTQRAALTSHHPPLTLPLGISLSLSLGG